MTTLQPRIDRFGIARFQPGSLVSVCWCEHQSVYVTPAEVRSGVTRSCGRRDCQPPPPRAA